MIKPTATITQMAYYLSWSETLGIGRDRSYYTPHNSLQRSRHKGQRGDFT
ncbi:hypothetical protein [Nostoc sp. DSM 114160]